MGTDRSVKGITCLYLDSNLSGCGVSHIWKEMKNKTRRQTNV